MSPKYKMSDEENRMKSALHRVTCRFTNTSIIIDWHWLSKYEFTSIRILQENFTCIY